MLKKKFFYSIETHKTTKTFLARIVHRRFDLRVRVSFPLQTVNGKIKKRNNQQQQQ